MEAWEWSVETVDPRSLLVTAVQELSIREMEGQKSLPETEARESFAEMEARKLLLEMEAPGSSIKEMEVR
jgi:hypothetical protein